MAKLILHDDDREEMLVFLRNTHNAQVEARQTALLVLDKVENEKEAARKDLNCCEARIRSLKRIIAALETENILDD